MAKHHSFKTEARSKSIEMNTGRLYPDEIIFKMDCIMITYHLNEHHHFLVVDSVVTEMKQIYCGNITGYDRKLREHYFQWHAHLSHPFAASFAFDVFLAISLRLVGKLAVGRTARPAVRSCKPFA